MNSMRHFIHFSFLLLSGEWKTLTFKKYNFQALGTPPEGGHLHPLLKVREEFRGIFLEMGCSSFLSLQLLGDHGKTRSSNAASPKCRQTTLWRALFGTLTPSFSPSSTLQEMRTTPSSSRVRFLGFYSYFIIIH